MRLKFRNYVEARGALILRIALLALTLGTLSSPQSAQAQNETFAELVARGVEAFRARDYESAVEAFRSAYELKPDPMLLYNVGQCLERQARLQDAISHYEAYVKAPGTTANDRAEALERIRALRKELAVREAMDAEQRAPSPALPPLEGATAPAKTKVRRLADPPPPEPEPSTTTDRSGPKGLVMIVNAKNDVAALSAADVRLIFLGRKRSWTDGGPIKALSRPPRSMAGRKFFSKKVGLDARDYRKHWQKRQLMGSALAPKEISSIEALLRTVAKSDGAIGFALASELPKNLNRGIRVIPLK